MSPLTLLVRTAAHAVRSVVSATKGFLVTAAAAAPGGGAAVAFVVAGAIVGSAALAVPAVRAIIRDRTPEQVRGLPGVETVIGVPAPTFLDAVYDIPAPLSVAASPDGTVLYVVEGKGDREVRRIPLEGGEPTVLAPPGTEPGTRKPVSVAVGLDGLVYVVDRLRGDVDMYDPAGTWLGILTPPAAPSLWQPLAVDVGPAGQVLVLNAVASGSPLAEYEADGRLADRQPLVDVGIEIGPLSFPSGVGLTDGGSLVFADSNNARIVVFDPETGAARLVGGGAGEEQLALPRGLAVDRRGHVLVADSTDHSVAVWDIGADTPRLLFRFGGQGFGDGEMLFPNDVALDARGNIYVADRDNDRVQIWH